MIIDPDKHPKRYSDPSEAFAWARRTLRDQVLTDPSVKKVHVMVGAPGSGKSTAAVAYSKHEPKAAYVDGCNANANERRRLARQIRDAGKLPIAVFVNTPLEICLRQNNRRNGPQRVPPNVIHRMHRELEKRPPRRIEGWHEIIEVTP